MGTEIDKLKAFSFGAGSSGDPSVVIPEQPQKKQKPMSKKLSSTISQCSEKMTEVVSWEAKIKENKAGLKLNMCLILHILCVFFFLEMLSPNKPQRVGSRGWKQVCYIIYIYSFKYLDKKRLYTIICSSNL